MHRCRWRGRIARDSYDSAYLPGRLKAHGNTCGRADEQQKARG
jgi:hypothetical protein